MAGLTLFFHSLSPNFFFKRDSGSSAYDIRSRQSLFVPSKGRLKVETGLSLGMPDGICGLLVSRSGLSLKHGIQVGAGLIDTSYRGPIGVILYNHSDFDFKEIGRAHV